MGESSIRLFLINELNRRKDSNSKYSMRAFAKDLGVSSGRLSDILHGRRQLGSVLAKRILSQLELQDPQNEDIKKLLAEFQNGLPSTGRPLHQLREDELSLLTEWEYFAVLSLLETKSARRSSDWVADRLVIPVEKAREVLTRLERMRLIVLKKNRYFLTYKKLTTTTDVSSEALKKAHHQIIQLALHSLYNHSVELRDITSISMAIDPKKIPQAKQSIRDFRQKLSRLLETGNKTEVYNLNIQLYPITKTEIRDRT